MSRPLIGVVGAGFVGATAAQRIVEKELGDLILADIIEGMPQGKALDLAQTGPVEGYDARSKGSSTVDDLKGCDLIVMTAGLPRKPGMTREDLLEKNAAIVGGVADKIKANSPNAIVIVVSNPLDVMTQLMLRRTGFPKNRVIGMAGVLDAARFAHFIAEKLDCSIKDVRTMVLGGHGDTMVPLPRYTTVSSIPVSELIPAAELDKLIKRTRDGGAEIVSLLKTGSAYYAPSAAAVAMAESILLDQKRILPCCVMLEGEYGIKGVCVGVPVKLGARGVEQIIELKLNSDELAPLKASAEKVREGTNYLKI
ncbi:MAG: malate dehydrogenase [Planctomycetota bacterium]|nr:malate dehydrogenase [Planctomycetota bacterium]